MQVPFTFEDINSIAGRYKPSTQKDYNNDTFVYWSRALFQRAAYAIDIKMPEMWDTRIKSMFYFWLYSRGFLGIFKTDDMGVVFQPGTVSQYDFYFQPKKFLWVNPYAEGDKNKEFEIGKDCALIQLAPDGLGIWDIIDYFARKLSNLSLSVDLSIINTRFAKIMGARNKAAGETLKKILDKINAGQPAVIYDEKLLDDRTDKASPFQIFGIEHLKENYITSMQWEDIRNILQDFEAEIGIPTYDKKERLVTYEAQMKYVECVPRVTIWVETLNACFKTANEMFGLDLHASIRERIYNNGIGNTNDIGVV